MSALPVANQAAPARLGRHGPAEPVHEQHRSAPEPPWLREARLRAARRVQFLRHRWEGSSYADEHLLAISHSEVDRALEPPGQARAEEAAFYRLDDHASALSKAIAGIADEAPDHRWQHLVGTFCLGRFEEALLALALGAAADPQLSRVFGYLCDGATPTGPTTALVYDLFGDIAEPRLGPDSAVLVWQLVRPMFAGLETAATSTPFAADPLLLAGLFGPSGAGSWSAGCRGSILPPPHEALRPRQVAEVADFVRALAVGPAAVSGAIEVELVGPAGSGRATLAASAAAALGIELVVLDGTSLAWEPDAAAAAVREVRRARLEGVAVALSHFEALHARPGLDASSPGAGALGPAVASVLSHCPLVFSCVEAPASEPAVAGAIRRSFKLAPLARTERLVLWSLLGTGDAPEPVASWALRPGEIATAAQAAPAGEVAVTEVCRRLLTASTDDLVTELPLPYTWDDLVLSPVTEAHLRELEAQARDRAEVLDGWGFSRLTPMGRGTTALLAGPSGTGKTMATQVLARSLGLDCLRVDLAGMVSKYIGETEKHLRKVFEACERAPALLFFDEADALFGKRTQVSDAHDRYANIEIDYVLQAMERFDGLAVLATNRKGDLDSAFVRRLRFIVDFAPPTVAERERLWRLCLEGARDLDGRSVVSGLDYPGLARELDLTGAGIKSAAVAAAFLARSQASLIELRHVVAAGRRELEKLGHVVRHGQLEWQ